MEVPNRSGRSYYGPIRRQPESYTETRHKVDFFRPKVHSHAEITAFVDREFAGEGREAERQRTAIRHALILYELSRAVEYERRTRDRGFKGF